MTSLLDMDFTGLFLKLPKIARLVSIRSRTVFGSDKSPSASPSTSISSPSSDTSSSESSTLPSSSSREGAPSNTSSELYISLSLPSSLIMNGDQISHSKCLRFRDRSKQHYSCTLCLTCRDFMLEVVSVSLLTTCFELSLQSCRDRGSLGQE